MRKEWNQFPPEMKMKFSQSRKEDFRITLVKAFLDHPDEPFTPTDPQIAALCNLPLRSANRYLKYWKDRGVFETVSKRYKHPAFGWCVQRTLTVNPVSVMIAREHLKLYGKVL